MSKSRERTATAKKIKKKYNKLLRGHIDFFNPENLDDNLDQFVLYLQYLRDQSILQEEHPERSLKVNTLHAAITEYEQYRFAKDQYNIFKESNEDTTKAEEEITYHLTSFCKLIIGGAKMWFTK